MSIRSTVRAHPYGCPYPRAGTSRTMGWVTSMANALAGASAGWLALGVLLHLANQAVRGRGWYAIVRAASPDERGLRRRDAILAWVAGAGAGGVVSARGGDVVRVLLLSRKAETTRGSVLTGTLVAEAAGDALVGAAVIGLAVALGAAPHFGLPGAADARHRGRRARAAGARRARPAPPRRPGARDRRRRRPRLRPARAPARVRAHGAALAGRLPRPARRRDRVLPARLRAARRRRRRAARDARPERRAPAAARAGLRRRLGRDAGRRLRPGDRRRRAGRHRRGVHGRHEPAADGRGRRARRRRHLPHRRPRRPRRRLARRPRRGGPRRSSRRTDPTEAHRPRGCGSPHARTQANTADPARGRT